MIRRLLDAAVAAAREGDEATATTHLLAAEALDAAGRAEEARAVRALVRR